MRLEWFRTERLATWLTHFEHCLCCAPGNGAAFFFSLRLTYADVAVFHALSEAAEQFPEHFQANEAQVPQLIAFMARMKQLPGIARYLTSGRQPLHRSDVSDAPEPPAPRPVRAPRSLVLGLPLLQAAAIVADAAAAAEPPPSGLPARRRRRNPNAQSADQESLQKGPSSSSSTRKSRAVHVQSI